MECIIIAYENNRELLGSNNATIVRGAKNMVKVNNALKSFNPSKNTDEIRIYSYTNIYNDETYNLIKTISIK